MPTSAEISLNPTSAKGDILTSNGSSRTRLGTGTNGQILVARSSATSGLQWESPGSSTANFEMLVSGTITSATSKIDVTMPSGRGTTYDHFLLIATMYKSTDDEYQSGGGYIIINNTTTGNTNLSWTRLVTYTNEFDGYSDLGQPFFANFYNGYSEESALSFVELEIFGEGPNLMMIQKAYNGRSSAADYIETLVNLNGTSLSTTSTISLWTGDSSYTYKAGTTIYVYGVKKYGV